QGQYSGMDDFEDIAADLTWITNFKGWSELMGVMVDQTPDIKAIVDKAIVEPTRAYLIGDQDNVSASLREPTRHSTPLSHMRETGEEQSPENKMHMWGAS
ncbi:hypothetical protein PENTCL1PPCAC_26430, partial [Pristionchus entomophagus]